MSELIHIAKSSTRGSVILFLGQFSSTIIMAITSILIARFLGPEEYGIYVIVFSVPSLVITISDLGISPALVRFSAYYRAKDENRRIASLIKTGIFIKSASSLILSLIMFLFADGIAANILRRPEISPLLQIACLYLIGGAILISVDSILVGLDMMGASGLLMNIHALIKAVASPLLIILGFGVIGATLGAGLGLIFAATIGILMLLLRIYPALVNNSRGSENFNLSQGLNNMISYGAPLYLLTLISTIHIQFRTILLTLFVSNADIGNYAIAMNFDVLMSVLTYPIATTLFPAFSKLDIEKNRIEIEKMFKLAVKYASLVIIPASLALAVLSFDAVYLLYGSQYSTASIYLSLYLLGFLYSAIGSLVIGPLINGQGYTRISLKIGIVGVAISIFLASILTPFYGVIGLIASILISPLISTSYALHMVHQKLRISVKPSSPLNILASSLLSALLVYIFTKLTPLTNPIYNLALGGTLYLISFLVSAPILGAISDEDIENLKNATNELPLVRTLAARILEIEKKILKLRRALINLKKDG